MAQIIVTIPDAVIPRVRAAFENTFNYTGLDPQGNAETRVQFFQRQINQFIKSITVRYEGQSDAETARIAAESKANSEIVIT